MGDWHPFNGHRLQRVFLLERANACQNLVRVAPWLQGYQDSKRQPNGLCSRPGFEYGARTEDLSEKDNRLHSKEHGIEAHEPDRSEDALFSAWRDEEDPKLRELMKEKERAPSTFTPPNGLREAPSPDSALFQPDSPPLSSPHGADYKTTKTRQPSPGPRKNHDHSLLTAGVSLPLADPPPSPEWHFCFYTNPKDGKIISLVGTIGCSTY